MNKTQAYNLFFRYALIILAGLGNLWIFYKLFTPLTVNITVFLLNFFSETAVINTKIFFNATLIDIIPACVAGSAYYLLFILVFSTPNIEIKKRLTILLSGFLGFFAFNIVRLVVLILINKSIYFEAIHLFFWYFLSTVFVLLIWIFSIKIFKIKDIPFYTDLKSLYKLMKKTV